MTAKFDNQQTKVLVVYGTRNGSTAGIAETIAAALEEDGLTAEVRPAAKVDSVVDYDAVVLGGALYAGHWHRDARRFARRFAKQLQATPVWLFSSGPLDDSAETTDIPPVAQTVRAADSLHARQHVTFGGRLSGDATGIIARTMVRSGRGGDFRNPERIRAWSRDIAAALKE